MILDSIDFQPRLGGHLFFFHRVLGVRVLLSIHRMAFSREYDFHLHMVEHDLVPGGNSESRGVLGASRADRCSWLVNTNRNILHLLWLCTSSYGFLIDDKVLWSVYLRAPAHWQPLDGVPVEEGPGRNDENEKQRRTAQCDE